ncbi:hypothetical protein PVAND_003010 [Polypedilum vanderplanki]|uniref:Peptidase S1 domain-containing protein n=1 Tax=Polypedilum vanderplanki TaxID=319348 RepID=A0A9J6BT63_POLVA|nr:hypothetical protein PVAND_003010 [Polypedilum vanderplanki]
MKFQTVILLIFVVACTYAITPDRNRRIVGGVNVLPGQIPHQALLSFFNTDFYFAGATLLNDRWVVSVANYLEGRAQNSIGIVVGAASLTGTVPTFQSDTIIIHENFNRNTMQNNIALVRSFGHIPTTLFVMPIQLNPSIIEHGMIATTSGFGATQPSIGPDSNFLQSRNIAVVTCIPNEYFNPVSQHLCTLPAICTRDIGGPLTLNNQLIGISLWHHPLRCGDQQSDIDVYVRITSFATWINSRIN